MSSDHPAQDGVALRTAIIRLVRDYGPLIVFFAVYQFSGVYTATAVFMAACVAALGLSWATERKLAAMPLFTAILVLIFGGLTLYLHNAEFIKIKVTVLYSFFGLLLLGGLAFERQFLRVVLAEALELSEAGWRALTIRFALFFFALAILNEIVWRNFPERFWVLFKFPGVPLLIFLFAMTQAPLILKHQLPEADEDGPKPGS